VAQAFCAAALRLLVIEVFQPSRRRTKETCFLAEPRQPSPDVQVLSGCWAVAVLTDISTANPVNAGAIRARMASPRAAPIFWPRRDSLLVIRRLVDQRSNQSQQLLLFWTVALTEERSDLDIVDVTA